MSVRLVHRPARITPALTFPEDTLLQEPAALPDAEQGGGNAIALIPLVGSAGAMTLMMTMRGSVFAAFGAILMIVMVVGAVIMFVSNRGKAERQRRAQRSRYLDYLEKTRRQLRMSEDEFRTSAGGTYPPPPHLTGLIHDDARLWERRRGNTDFLTVRVGAGARPIRRIEVRATEDPSKIEDEFMMAEARLVARRFSVAADVPVAVSLDRVGHVSVVGPDGGRLARAVLAGATALNSPEDLQVGLVAPEARAAEWEWAQWLPHASRGARAEGALRIAPTLEALQALVHRELESRTSRAAEVARSGNAGTAARAFARLLLVVDARDGAPGFIESPDPRFSLADLGVTVLHLVANRLREPESIRIRFTQSGPETWIHEHYTSDEGLPDRIEFSLDPFTVEEAETLARELSPLRLSEESLEHSETRAVAAFTEMMGIPDIRSVDFDRLWSRHTESTFLRVPIGVDDGGGQVVLDLKESAQFGMGPHGLCVGATGSGKSELLRSLVLGLLATHGPEDLAMVLVDYKGGATFAPFVNAPQVSGLITNLSDDATLVDRVYTSLEGEILRRQEALRAAGNINDITRYRLRREEVLAEGGAMEPLPHLMVIIDEFGELLTARPDFIDLFLQIGRIGRSIGVHLLLSSQRIEGGRLQGLETYLSYRLGLRTLSEGESRSVLETPDAFHLPPLPGYGYLKVDTTVYSRFRAGYVSGELPAPEAEAAAVEEWRPRIGTSSLYRVRYPSQRPEEGQSAAARPGRQTTTAPTVMSTILDQLQLRPRAVAPIWLPPLPDVLTLSQIDGPPHATPAGLRITAGEPLRLPIGILDDPGRQDQRRWELDLTAAGGNHVVVGGPQSGKTTLLQTIAVSAALTHGPDELGVYALDLLGSSLLPLEGLPHVGGVATRLDPEVVRRTVEELSVMLQEREVLFEKYRVDSLSSFRRRRAAGEITEVGSTDILVLVDGWGVIREEFETLEDQLKTLATRGPGYGIRFVVTGSKSTDIRFNLASSFPGRIEMRLTDPMDSQFGRKAAERMPEDRPGRSMIAGELFAHAALPRIDAVADTDDLSRGIREATAAIAASTTGRARQVRLLPRIVTPADLRPDPLRPELVPVGLEESSVKTHYFDLLDRDANVMVLGESETGKTTLLKYLVEQMLARHTPNELVIAVFDPKRNLRDVFPPEYVGGYASSVAVAGGLVQGIIPDLDSRVPRTVESQDSAETMAGKPRILMVMDDYDMIQMAGTNLLGELRRHIALSAEIRFQIFLTRRIQGASRALFDAGFSALRDSGAVGVQLSGDRAEGMLLGNVRPTKMPPGRGQVIRSGYAPEIVQFVLPTS